MPATAGDGIKALLYQEELTDSHAYNDTRCDDRDEANALTVALSKVLRYLTDREIIIVRSRYGLFGEQARTLEEIGAVLLLTRERVRQIEATALSKLKNRRLSCILEPFHPATQTSMERSHENPNS